MPATTDALSFTRQVLLHAEGFVVVAAVLVVLLVITVRWLLKVGRPGID